MCIHMCLCVCVYVSMCSFMIMGRAFAFLWDIAVGFVCVNVYLCVRICEGMHICNCMCMITGRAQHTLL